MMQKDEEEAVKTIEKHQQVLDKFVPAYQGEILNYYGDRALCVFDNPILGVQAGRSLNLIFKPLDHG